MSQAPVGAIRRVADSHKSLVREELMAYETDLTVSYGVA
jgi:hypothetical protein